MAGAADRGRSAVQCVLCLGHNKGMEEAASDLAVRGFRVRFAGVITLERVSWGKAGSLLSAHELGRVATPTEGYHARVGTLCSGCIHVFCGIQSG